MINHMKLKKTFTIVITLVWLLIVNKSSMKSIWEPPVPLESIKLMEKDWFLPKRKSLPRLWIWLLMLMKSNKLWLKELKLIMMKDKPNLIKIKFLNPPEKLKNLKLWLKETLKRWLFSQPKKLSPTLSKLVTMKDKDLPLKTSKNCLNKKNLISKTNMTFWTPQLKN